MAVRKYIPRLCIGILVLAIGLLAALPGRTLAAKSANQPRRIVGYFTSWGIYGKGYRVRNIKESGSAARLTHINYAFANISTDLKCAIGDAWADYQKPFSAEESVDGVADPDSWTALRGNFNQLLKLKNQYGTKALIAIGGWTWSDKFSDAALTDASRKAFVSSCIDMFIKGNLGDGVVGPGVFDGIDIDWEYPGACGNTCNFRPEDTQNFTLLLAEFRSQLNTLSATTGKPYLLTIASPAGEGNFSKIQLNQIHQYLDWINLMTYDFHGPWENTANFNSPLYASPNDPSGPKLNADYTVRAYLAAGIPSRKLVLGVPFFGHGWQGVPSANNGLYQSATGPAPGTFEPGTDDYRVLKTLEASYSVYRDRHTKALWIYNPATHIFWSYDDPVSMKRKARYVDDNNLGGVMFWELSGDDTTGSLITALHFGLRN